MAVTAIANVYSEHMNVVRDDDLDDDWFHSHHHMSPAPNRESANIILNITNFSFNFLALTPTHSLSPSLSAPSFVDDSK